MGKTKNRRKAPAQQEQGGFNRFLRDMLQAIVDSELLGILKDYSKASLYVKRKTYEQIFHINNPKAGNEFITPGELKEIAVKIKRYYRERILKIKSAYISNYQRQLIISYVRVRSVDIVRQTGNKNNEDAALFKQFANSLTQDFYGSFFLDCCRILTQQSNPARKYYSIDIRMAALFKENPSADFVIEIYGTPAKKSMIGINGVWRPIFQMGRINFQHHTEWITVQSDLLKDHYQGKRDLLPVFIQSHALTRLKERLDILNEEALNYSLWENTCDIKSFMSYKGYLLLPFKLFDIRIGYLVANIMDDKIVFRTFLFITHNCTPEGDKLRRITGLGKHDITYWKIDRLSTFINFDLNKNADLVELLNDAGMSDLWQLKEKTFHIDDLQIANLDGLMEYIKKGKMEVLEPV